MKMQNELNLAQWVSDAARKQGAGDVSVSISHIDETEVAVRSGVLEKVQQSTKSSLSLGIYIDGRFASNTTNDLQRDSLNDFIKNSVDLAGFLAPDKCRALPDPKYYPQLIDQAKLEICDPAHGDMTMVRRIDMAKAAEEATRNISDKLVSTTAGVYDSSARGLLFHSSGFSGCYETTVFSVNAEATVKDGDRSRPEDYTWATARYYADLPSPEEIGRDAVRRALSRIGQEKIATGSYVMVVENRVAARLIRLLIEPMRAAAIQQKRSYLDGLKSKKIGSDKLTIIDDPTLARGMGSRVFDDEGLAAKRRTMIENGVLLDYYVDTYYGRKLKMEPTTSGPSNLVVAAGARSSGEIIKSVDRGILVNSFLGGNSNSTTGDFSIGISGQLIEHGKVVKPVSSMNIAGNSKALWNQLSETANDPFVYDSWRCPTMVFDNISFSGI